MKLPGFEESIEAPYTIKAEGRWFRTYIVQYDGAPIRYLAKWSDARDLVFLLNTAYAEGGRGLLHEGHIFYRE